MPSVGVQLRGTRERGEALQSFVTVPNVRGLPKGKPLPQGGSPDHHTKNTNFPFFLLCYAWFAHNTPKMDFSEIRASDLLDTLQIGVVVHSCDTSVLYANPKALEFLNLTENQVLGATACAPVWRFLDQYGEEMHVEDYPVNQVVGNRTTLKDLQLGIDAPSGPKTWLNCNAYPEFSADGTIRRIVVNFIDISEQKEAIPFKEVVSLCHDAILVTEANTTAPPGPKILYANEAFYQLTGYSEEEVLGNTPRMLQGERTCRETRRRIRQALKDKVPIRETLLNYRKDGTTYWNELSLFPLKNKYGEVVHFVGVQRDASVRKEREEEVNKTNQKLHDRNLELKRINEQKNQILGVVAHDLRNPLYALTTAFEIVSDLVDENDPELFGIINTSINHMNAIIEDLVTSRGLHAPESRTSRQTHLLNELIHEVVKLNAPSAKKKGITIGVEVPDDIKACVDYGQLQRALDNLLSNAIKFSPSRSNVLVGCEIVGSGLIRLFVHDSGPGLTEDDKAKVFGPFQRLSAQPTAGEASTGLGLSIVKKIAELHGGDAGVISDHCDGAKFYLDIPC
jgi:PAS domain S-box-containing protein